MSWNDPPKPFAEYQPRSPEMPRQALPDRIDFDHAAPADAQGIAHLIARREGFSEEQAMEKVLNWLNRPADTHMQLVARLDRSVVAHARAALVSLDDSVPRGWYLSGVIVEESLRRRGIAQELTRLRIDWLTRHAAEAFYFVSSLNLASIDLHREFGFEEIRRPFRFPGVHFSGGGVGILFRAALG